MKLIRKNDLTYLVHKKVAWAVMEWPVIVLVGRRYVLYLRLNNWLLVPAKGKGHDMIDWTTFIYGKWWAFLCFQLYKTEKAPPLEIWDGPGLVTSGDDEVMYFDKVRDYDYRKDKPTEP